MKCRLITLLIFIIFSMQIHAQEKEPNLEDLSLEQLLNVPIKSASKTNETLFDAPLSSYTITQSDIKKAGSTSIMEALRLAPGVIVREQTNGSYDIHIRGFDNILRHSETFTKMNLATLVMIDNRPVFNHNLGGTFWEALPIDLNDVERIEIVRGPSAPLFGPNAVTGVINIITKRDEVKSTYANATVQQGTSATSIANAMIGRKISDKFIVTASGNFQLRDRFSTDYYSVGEAQYKPIDNILPSTYSASYPNIKRAMNKSGVNASVCYKANEKINADLTIGLQQSEVQKILGSTGASIGSGTFITTNRTQSKYVNLLTKLYGLTIRGSYLQGHDNINLKSPPSQYDYQIGEVTGEYEIKLGKKASVVPGISYQNANYSDKDYVGDGLNFLAGKEVSITTTSAFVRTDVKPIKNLRIIAAGRADKFSVPDKTYFAYEFATTYRLAEHHLIRAAVTRSNSGSFVANNYLNLVIPNVPIPGVDFVRRGQPNINLLTINMIEFGYRVQFTKVLQVDIDVFQQTARNMNALVAKPPYTLQESTNIPTTATQLGTTLSINFVPSDKFQFKPFVTFQKTDTDQLMTAYVEGASTTSGRHTNTPGIYGGYYLNYKPSTKFNININGYYFAAHRQYDASDPTDTSDAGNISGKMLVNLKAAYALTKNFNVFLNGRNILNNDSREFFGADRIGGLYLVGASFSLN